VFDDECSEVVCKEVEDLLWVGIMVVEVEVFGDFELFFMYVYVDLLFNL